MRVHSEDTRFASNMMRKYLKSNGDLTSVLELEHDSCLNIPQDFINDMNALVVEPFPISQELENRLIENREIFLLIEYVETGYTYTFECSQEGLSELTSSLVDILYEVIEENYEGKTVVIPNPPALARHILFGEKDDNVYPEYDLDKFATITSSHDIWELSDCTISLTRYLSFNNLESLISFLKELAKYYMDEFKEANIDFIQDRLIYICYNALCKSNQEGLEVQWGLCSKIYDVIMRVENHYNLENDCPYLSIPPLVRDYIRRIHELEDDVLLSILFSNILLEAMGYEI